RASAASSVRLLQSGRWASVLFDSLTSRALRLCAFACDLLLSPEPLHYFPSHSADPDSTGKNTRKHAPLPGSLETRIQPWCWSTIFETIESPSPTPSFLVVKKGLKICSPSPSVTPGPVSWKSISTPRRPFAF